MANHRPTTPADRDRSLRLTRRVTAAVATGGAGAVAVFGFLAAGHAAGASTTATTSTSTSNTTAVAPSASTSSSTQSIAAPTAAPTSSAAPTAQAVTGGSGHG